MDGAPIVVTALTTPDNTADLHDVHQTRPD
jgi:hypothetical protein